MVPLVLCFKTMWSVPDTVSWGADYASYADSYMLVLLSNEHIAEPACHTKFKWNCKYLDLWMNVLMVWNETCSFERFIMTMFIIT